MPRLPFRQKRLERIVFVNIHAAKRHAESRDWLTLGIDDSALDRPVLHHAKFHRTGRIQIFHVDEVEASVVRPSDEKMAFPVLWNLDCELALCSRGTEVHWLAGLPEQQQFRSSERLAFNIKHPPPNRNYEPTLLAGWIRESGERALPFYLR